MKRMLVLLGWLISLSAYGQVPEFEWVGAFGGNINDAAYDVVTDKWGNVYVTGGFRLTADADFGPDEHLLQAGNDSDIYIAKYAPDRSLLWAHCFSGGYDGSAGIALATDTIGHVYLITNIDFYSYVDFDPGPGVSAVSTDETQVGIILKLTSEGDFVWVKSLGGEEPFAHVDPLSVALDGEGNIYTTGVFRNKPDFDPGDDAYILTDNGFGSVFLSKLTQHGDFVWVRSLGGATVPGIVDTGFDLAVDNEGEIYVAGYFDEDLFPDTLMEFSSINLHAIGALDMFVVKYNQEGHLLWAKSIGDSLSSIDGRGLVIDQQKNVYVTGSFSNTVDFDPGQGQYELSATGLNDAYILKLDTDGNFVWAIATESQIRGSCSSSDLAFDNQYKLYATGLMHGLVDFDPSTEEYILSDEYASFVWKIDSLNNNVWAVSFGESFYGMSGASVSGTLNSDIFVDYWGNVYSSGTFSDTVDFDPGAGIMQVISASPFNRDAFLHKMRQYPCNSDVVSITSNDTFSICTGESLILEATLPDTIFPFSYSWSTGEDNAIISLSPDSTTTYTVEVYHAPACTSRDTVVIYVSEEVDTLFLTESTCDTMVMGIFTDTLINIAGCDTIVITNVLLVTPPAMPFIQATLIIEQGEAPFDLGVEEVQGANSYLWTVPPGVQILSGQGTNHITIAWDDQIINGIVCVSTLNECGSSPSACTAVTVDITNAIQNPNTKGYRIFPNPTSGMLQVVFEEIGLYEIVLLDVLGKTLSRTSVVGENGRVSIQGLDCGTYWLKIESRDDASSEPRWERVEVLR